MDHRQQELRQHREGSEHRRQIKETAQKSYMIGKNKSHTRDNVEYAVHTCPSMAHSF